MHSVGVHIPTMERVWKPTGKPQNTFEGNDGKRYDLSWIIKG